MKLIADLEALLAKYAHINGSIQRELANPPSQTLFSTGELVILATYLDALPAILTALRAAEEWTKQVPHKGKCPANRLEVDDRMCTCGLTALRSALAALGEGPRGNNAD